MADSELENFVDLCTAAAIQNVSDLKLEASDGDDDDCVEILDEVRRSSSSSSSGAEEDVDDDVVSLVDTDAVGAPARKPSTAAEEDGCQIRWTQELSVDEVKVEPFTRSSGPVHSLAPGAEPLEFLKLFLDDALMERIASETNRCAAQSNAAGWKPATRATVSTFLGVLLVMGINVLPELNQYWATDDCLGNEFIQRAMSRNRFKNLMRYLRLTDDQKMPKKGESGYDPLYRVRPLMDHLLAAFHRRFVPFRDITVDEATCRFKGTMDLSPCPEAKPAKYGIKVFMSACAASGYVHSFFVHTGADEFFMKHGMGHYTMMQLTRRLRGHRHHVYFGKFFTSSRLLRDLLRRGVYACGLARAFHRGFPPDLRDARPQRGAAHFRQSGQLVACAWGEKKRVATLSTNSRPVMEAAPPRRPGFGTDGGCARRPQPVGNFNASKDGADMAVHLRTCYSLGREGKKWWRHLIFVLVNTALANAYTVYRLSNMPPPKLPASHLQFRLLLAKQLVAGYAEGRAAKRPRRKREIEKVISTEHLSKHVCVKFAGRKRVCVLCSRRGRRTAKGRGVQSSYGCAICNVHLCRVGCFLQYHEMAHLPTNFVVDPAVQVVHCPAPRAPRRPRRTAAAARGSGHKAARKPARKAAAIPAKARAPPPSPPPPPRPPRRPLRRRRRSSGRTKAGVAEESGGEESDCVAVTDSPPKRIKLESEPEVSSEDEFVEEVDKCTQVSEVEEDEEERPGCGGGGGGGDTGGGGGDTGGGGGGDGGGTLVDGDHASRRSLVARDVDEGPSCSAQDSGGEPAAAPVAEEKGADGGARATPAGESHAGAADGAARGVARGGGGFERPSRQQEAEGAVRTFPWKLSSGGNSPDDSCEPPGTGASLEGGGATSDGRAADREEINQTGERERVPAAEGTQDDAKHLTCVCEAVPARHLTQEYKPEQMRVYSQEASAKNLYADAPRLGAFATTASETPSGLAQRPAGDSPQETPSSPFARVHVAPQVSAASPESGQTAGADRSQNSRHAAQDRAPITVGDADTQGGASQNYAATEQGLQLQTPWLGPRGTQGVPRAHAGQDRPPIPLCGFLPQAPPLRVGCDVAERAARGRAPRRAAGDAPCRPPPPGTTPASRFPCLYPPMPPPPPPIQHPHHLLGPAGSLTRQAVGSAHLAPHAISPQRQQQHPQQQLQQHQHHGYPALGLYPFQELHRQPLPPLLQPLPPQLQQKQQRVEGGGGGEAVPLPYGLQDPYGLQHSLYGAHVPPQHGEQ